MVTEDQDEEEDDEEKQKQQQKTNKIRQYPRELEPEAPMRLEVHRPNKLTIPGSWSQSVP